MNPEQENFEQLRQLLALKRHESPPAGFFNDFSRQVVLKIQRQEQRSQHLGSGRLNREAPWIVRIWQLLEAKPLLAGSFGMLACGLLVAGLVYSETPGASGPSVAALSAQATQPADELAMEPGQPARKPLIQSPEPEASSVSGAAMLPGETGLLIDQIGAPVFQPASFLAPAH
jgi:hypothetical protein